jgi:hypothetical protein
MKPKEAKVRVKIEVHIGFWQAIKLRIAGGKAMEEFLRASMEKTIHTTFNKKEVSNASPQSRIIVP